MSGDTSRIATKIQNGVLKLKGELRYQDRDLRLACMMLISCPQHRICMDLSDVPTLCSPELQFITKMANLARDKGKFFQVKLSRTLRQLFKDLELEGLVEIVESDSKPPAVPPKTPGTPPM